MANELITLLQALQLVGLVPCLFVIAFLFLAARNFKKSIIPALYFFVLAVSFFLPLSDLFSWSQTTIMKALLLFFQSLTPALSFLLIIQFMQGRIPPLIYWFILAIPAIGGSSIVYGTVLVDELCFGAGSCIGSNSIRMLYNIFGSSLLYLLLIFSYRHSTEKITHSDINRAHKYWLIMAIIMLSLQLLIVDLALLADRITQSDAMMISTIIRFTFIYLVLTSLFRVFDKIFELDYEKIPSAAVRRTKSHKGDESVISAINTAMSDQHVYREMSYTREALSSYLNIPEHQLSRIINVHYNQNFNELVNSYRIEEAKDRLKNEESTSITVIAFEVGFNSIASFNRVFKALVGCSPSEYRAGRKK